MEFLTMMTSFQALNILALFFFASKSPIYCTLVLHTLSKTGVDCGDKTPIGWTKNKHCWAYVSTSFAIVRTTYMSFSATAVFSWPQGQYAYI
jgi:hypothetical protein